MAVAVEFEVVPFAADFAAAPELEVVFVAALAEAALALAAAAVAAAVAVAGVPERQHTEDRLSGSAKQKTRDSLA